MHVEQGNQLARLPRTSSFRKSCAPGQLAILQTVHTGNRTIPQKEEIDVFDHIKNFIAANK